MHQAERLVQRLQRLVGRGDVDLALAGGEVEFLDEVSGDAGDGGQLGDRGAVVDGDLGALHDGMQAGDPGGGDNAGRAEGAERAAQHRDFRRRAQQLGAQVAEAVGGRLAEVAGAEGPVQFPRKLVVARLDLLGAAVREVHRLVDRLLQAGDVGVHLVDELLQVGARHAASPGGRVARPWARMSEGASGKACEGGELAGRRNVGDAPWRRRAAVKFARRAVYRQMIGEHPELI